MNVPRADVWSSSPQERATFAAIFKGGDDSYLQVSQLVSWDWGSETLEADQVASMREAVDETYDIYNVDSTEAHDVSFIGSREYVVILTLSGVALYTSL